MELYCTICEECITGCFESNSENCIPDDEERTTQRWQKMKNICTECVYVSQNTTGLKSRMKKKHGI